LPQLLDILEVLVSHLELGFPVPDGDDRVCGFFLPPDTSFDKVFLTLHHKKIRDIELLIISLMASFYKAIVFRMAFSDNRPSYSKWPEDIF